MSGHLKTTIERLANDFARDLLHALKEASFLEFVTELRAAPGATRPARSAGPAASSATKRRRRGRRSTGDLSTVVDRIVTTLKAAGAKGLRSEELRKQVGLPRAKLMRPVEIALAKKRIHKTGSRRATTYFAR